MMNSIRRLSQKTSVFFAIIFFCLACEAEKKDKNYVAKVSDSLLTNEDILELKKFKKNERFVDGELTRKWIDSEVIDNEAKSKGIYQSKEFIKLAEEQKIKFAEVILLNEYFEENYEVPGNFELQSFYDSNKENFVIQQSGFVISVISFTDEQTAIKYRNLLVDSDWEKVFSKFSDSEFLKASIEKKFYFVGGFYNYEILKLINQMEDGEVSIIINSEPDDFKIVQVHKKYERFSIPEFNFIKDLVEERYKIKKTQELYKEYFSKLYQKYNLELKTE